MTTLAELLTVHRGLTEVHVERWVARGLLRPVGPLEAWKFESVDIARVRLLARAIAAQPPQTREAIASALQRLSQR